MHATLRIKAARRQRRAQPGGACSPCWLLRRRWAQTEAPPQSTHWLLMRICGQMPVPPQSLQELLWWLCWQMLVPPSPCSSASGGYAGRCWSLHSLLMRSCWQMPVPPQSLQMLLTPPVCADAAAPAVHTPAALVPARANVPRRPRRRRLLSRRLCLLCPPRRLLAPGLSRHLPRCLPCPEAAVAQTFFQRLFLALLDTRKVERGEVLAAQCPICIHAYIHTYIHTCMHACMHAYIHTYIHTYIHMGTMPIFLNISCDFSNSVSKSSHHVLCCRQGARWHFAPQYVVLVSDMAQEERTA